MKSDLTLDASQFSPANTTRSTEKACEFFRKNDDDEYSKGIFGDAPRMRASMSDNPKLEGENIGIPSREPERVIPCRVIRPKASKLSAGIFLHFHGGGFVVGSHDRNDPLLDRFANASGCVVVSVGYRLTPENAYSDSQHDCFDVADYILDKGVDRFGGNLQFIGGESAGGHLALQTFYHIAGNHKNWDSLKGLVLTYGSFSCSFLPNVYNAPNPVCIDQGKMDWYCKTAFSPPNDQTLESYCEELESEFGSLAQRGLVYDSFSKHPAISPLYRSLEKLRSRLPPAFFICGTADPLLDDTILMSARWQIAGGRAVVKFVTGAPHAFVELPTELADCCELGNGFIREFLQEASA